MTVHVPTVPEAKKVCWEFATDGYDIGFGIYFDWTPVTNRSITVHISESSDDEDEEEELEGQSVLAIQNLKRLNFSSHLCVFQTFSWMTSIKIHQLFCVYKTYPICVFICFPAAGILLNVFTLWFI